MKNDTLLILGAAAAALYVITRMTKPRPVTVGGAASLNQGGQVNVPGYTKQIFNSALPGTEAWGWQYFTDGTAIGPDGSYYQGGQKVWSPT